MGSAFRMAKASGADQPVLDDLDTSRRKLSSPRKAKAPKVDPNAPANEDGTPASHSAQPASQSARVDRRVA
jgi:hypothetical protein